jgi:hypothetical protein
MLSSTFRPTSWLLFRACVTLRQILALRKPRKVQRARKAAAICGVILSLAHCGYASEQTSAPARNRDAADFSVDPAIERIRPLNQVGTALTPPQGDLPPDLAQRRFGTAPFIVASEVGGRGWAEFTYLWQAPALAYRPLYFEEPNLERYGHSAGCVLQPALSGAHFLMAVSALPMRVAFDRPWELVYPLGHALPGSPSPWERPW